VQGNRDFAMTALMETFPSIAFVSCFDNAISGEILCMMFQGCDNAQETSDLVNTLLGPDPNMKDKVTLKGWLKSNDIAMK